MSKFQKLSINNITKETEDSVSITFDLSKVNKSDFAFSAGQYITLKTTIQGEDIRRAYSICKAPHENELTVLVKKVEGGKFSTLANNVLKIGDELEVMPPEGSFVNQHKKKETFFAAGSGITPVISIIKDKLQNDEFSQITLIYGSKSESQTIFKKEIDKLIVDFDDRLKVVYTYSQQKTDDELVSGRINKAKCSLLNSRNILSYDADTYYMCGPEEMINTVKDNLLENGVNKNNIKFELFTVSSNNDDGSVSIEEYSGPVNVKMVIDDDEFEFMYTPNDSNSLLDAGSDSGLDVPFSCKGGVCCTCKAKITEGKANMRVNYALTDEEVEEGYVLTCQAHALTGDITVNFDE